jgi:single-stranded DNA-binding protein
MMLQALKQSLGLSLRRVDASSVLALGSAATQHSYTTARPGAQEQLAVITDPGELRHNIVSLCGNVINNPNLRYYGEQAVVEFTIAQVGCHACGVAPQEHSCLLPCRATSAMRRLPHLHVQNRKRRDGSREDDPTFYTCVSFGSLANTIVGQVRRGSRVQLQGRLQQQRVPTKKEDTEPEAAKVEGKPLQNKYGGPANYACKVGAHRLCGAGHSNWRCDC